jgi:hypothetical protein
MTAIEDEPSASPSRQIRLVTFPIPYVISGNKKQNQGGCARIGNSA